MFDLRYHVASLAAVFLALIIGILVGAGLATRTDVEGSERRVLQDRIEELQQRNDDVVAQADLLRRQREAAENYVANTYPALMNGRLRGKRVALLFTGQPDDDALDAVEQTLQDASGPSVVEREAFELPIDPEQVMDALGPEFQGLTMEEVGRRLGEELVAGGETPFWDALIPVLVQDDRLAVGVASDRRGDGQPPPGNGQVGETRSGFTGSPAGGGLADADAGTDPGQQTEGADQLEGEADGAVGQPEGLGEPGHLAVADPTDLELRHR